jgi:hypothetical protein
MSRQLRSGTRESPLIVRWLFVDFLELTVAALLAFIFIALRQTEFLHVVGIFAALLTAMKVSLRITMENVKQEMIGALAPLNRLEKVLDLQGTAPYEQLEAMTRTYAGIPEPELAQVKNRIIQEALDKLRQLAHRRASEELPTSEYYGWLLPMLRQVRSGERITAVSLLFDSEWDDSEVERKFLEENIAAVRRGISVERVFIVAEANLDAALSNPGVVAHRPKAGTGLEGFMVSREYLQKHDPELLRRAGDGFIQIDRRVALIDSFSEVGEVRGYVTINGAELRQVGSTFEQLKTLAKSLPTLEPQVRARWPERWGGVAAPSAHRADQK